MDEPRKTFEIICDKYDKKSNNKLYNICKELKSCTLKNTKVYPDDWITDLYHLNDRIENIIIDFKNTEKQLAMHIMNNMCNKYKDSNMAIENKVS